MRSASLSFSQHLEIRRSTSSHGQSRELSERRASTSCLGETDLLADSKGVVQVLRLQLRESAATKEARRTRERVFPHDGLDSSRGGDSQETKLCQESRLPPAPEGQQLGEPIILYLGKRAACSSSSVFNSLALDYLFSVQQPAIVCIHGGIVHWTFEYVLPDLFLLYVISGKKYQVRVKYATTVLCE